MTLQEFVAHRYRILSNFKRYPPYHDFIVFRLLLLSEVAQIEEW